MWPGPRVDEPEPDNEHEPEPDGGGGEEVSVILDPDPDLDPLVMFIKSKEKMMESSFTEFNSNPGMFRLFCNNSL
jgi:hypothetical protein